VRLLSNFYRVVSGQAYGILAESDKKQTLKKHPIDDVSDQEDTYAIPHSKPAAGTASIEAAEAEHETTFKRLLKLIGPGVITGASDDDPPWDLLLFGRLCLPFL